MEDHTVETTLNSFGVLEDEQGLRTMHINMIEEDGECRIDDIVLSEYTSLRLV